MSAVAVSGRTAESADTARWILAGAVALAVHAGILVPLIAGWTNPPSSESDVPAVLIDMAPPSSAPAAPPAVTPPNLVEPESAAPLPTMEPTPPEQAPEMPPPATEALLMPEPPAPLATDQPPLVEAPPVPAPKDAVVVPPPPRKVLAQPKAEPPRKTVVERKPPRPVQADTRGELSQSRRAPAAASGAPAAATGPSASASDSAASKARWHGQLVAYLQRNLRYPPGTGNGGSAAVTFSMSRSGQVLSARVARSAGSADLDSAALATFRGSLPPPPPDVPGASFAFTIPVRFNRSF